MSVLATARNKVKSTLTAPGRKTVDARAGGRWAVPQTQHNAQATLYEHNSIISMCNKPVVRTKREKRLYFTVQTRVNSTIYRQIGSRTHKPPNFPAACKGRCMGGRTYRLLQPGHAPMLAPAALAARLTAFPPPAPPALPGFEPAFEPGLPPPRTTVDSLLLDAALATAPRRAPRPTGRITPAVGRVVKVLGLPVGGK